MPLPAQWCSHVCHAQYPVKVTNQSCSYPFCCGLHWTCCKGILNAKEYPTDKNLPWCERNCMCPWDLPPLLICARETKKQGVNNMNQSLISPCSVQVSRWQWECQRQHPARPEVPSEVERASELRGSAGVWIQWGYGWQQPLSDATFWREGGHQRKAK